MTLQEKQTINQMKSKKVYLVQYNGKYESTPYFQKSIEVILSKKSDFKKWLKQHNEERKKDGDLPEGSDEFDVIPQTLISYE